MEDAYQSTNEVVGVGIGAQIAAGDGAFDQLNERSVDEAARAFDQTHRSTGNGVHCGNDELFLCNVVNEQKHPGAQCFDGRQGGGQAPPCGGKLFHLDAIDGFNQGIASGEVTIKRSRAYARLTGDVIKAGRCAIPSEGMFGDLENSLAISLRVGTEFAGGRS